MALALAVAFAVLLNLALVTSLVWTEILDSWHRNILWTVVGVVWFVSAVVSARWWQSRESPQPDLAQDLFRHSLNQYLQGNWIEAERRLRRLLRKNSHDVDARLLLVGVMRHTHRIDEAHRQLDRLVACEGAEKWQTEIDREYALLDREQHEEAIDEPQRPTDETTRASEAA